MLHCERERSSLTFLESFEIKKAIYNGYNLINEQLDLCPSPILDCLISVFSRIPQFPQHVLPTYISKTNFKIHSCNSSDDGSNAEIAIKNFLKFCETYRVCIFFILYDIIEQWQDTHYLFDVFVSVQQNLNFHFVLERRCQVERENVTCILIV